MMFGDVPDKKAMPTGTTPTGVVRISAEALSYLRLDPENALLAGALVDTESLGVQASKVTPTATRKGAPAKGMAAAKSEPSVVGAVEAARICGISRTSWYSLKAAGRLPLPVRLGRRVLWRVEELKEWLDAGCPALHRWQQMSGDRK